jgi:cbb3-type cytochrome oxidase maturation protein
LLFGPRMIILLVLIPVTLLPIGAAGIALFWAVGNDQADDMRTPGLLLGGIVGSAVRWLDVETVRRSLRALSPMVFLIASKPIKRDV